MTSTVSVSPVIRELTLHAKVEVQYFYFISIITINITNNNSIMQLEVTSFLEILDIIMVTIITTIYMHIKIFFFFFMMMMMMRIMMMMMMTR
jgi:hypothetical protein